MNDLNGKTILVTGATGFIGTHLHRRLAELSDASLLLVSRRPPVPSKRNEIWIASELANLTPRSWSDLGIDHIDVVFHLGGFTPKSSKMADHVDEIYRANLSGTRALLESLPGVPGTVVFSSTLDVYQPPAEREVLTESSAVAPPSLYGASKLFGEHLIQAYSRRTGCRFAVLRYGHIYGPGEDAYAKLIPVAIHAILKKESPVVYGDGEVLRDFLYVDDAVEATLRAAMASEAKVGPLNIVSGESVSIREVVELLAGLSPERLPVTYLRDKPGGYSLRFSNAKMREVLGHWPFVPLEQGLSQEFAATQEKL